ncbi:DUF4286 family protein [uncultured Ruegeria sp.]|uniref:DUF4286 family protein n=1 Tax=uncultured Ruegeria sp. TaxID=259304 RepID=UPI00261E0F12|nr:DUF4286 family protein [uncultured Ruegeria sp.]
MAIREIKNAELFVWTDIDPQYEQDFNLWYDREHMEERVAIEGFQWARRYRNVSNDARRYLALYRTENIGTFGTASYRKAFESQTDWSNRNFERMTNTKRRVMHVVQEGGFGLGAAVAMITLPSKDIDAPVVNPVLATVSKLDGVLSLHCMSPDETLSMPLPSEDPTTRSLEAVIVIDATTVSAAEAAAETMLDQLELSGDRSMVFNLIWELRTEDLQKIAAANAA